MKILSGSLIVILALVLTAGDMKKPRILIIGDSISLGYTPYVKEYFKDKAIVVHNPGNAGHTGMGLENIRKWVGDEDWDMIQFNWGLWDLCYRHPDSELYGNRDKVNGKITYTIDEYRANLDSIVTILKSLTDAELIFVCTTYVPEEEGGRYKNDAQRYNRAAKEVMKKHGVLVNDIFKESRAIHKKYGVGSDDVHYTDQGNEQLSRCIIDYLNIVFPGKAKSQDKFDVIVYGGTSAGIAAAIECSRMNKKVLLVEPSMRIGGLTTGGLGATDIGNKSAIGGISREFYQNIRTFYDNPENWKWQNKEDYHEKRNTGNEDAMWTFEPSAALAVYEKMIEDENIKLVFGERLNRKNGVYKKGAEILKIEMENGSLYAGEMFIDATYEGDLMAASGVSYTVGRESNLMYGETLNGVQANKISLTLRGTISRNSVHHNFIDGVDPYIEKGDPSSGLLPFLIKGGPGIDGHGDKGIQAYCFRMTLTDLPENRIPFQKPDHYNELDYELLFRNYEAADGPLENMYHYGDPLIPWINSAMPNRKTDTNNQKGFSTDFVGQNFEYPEASYEERQNIISRHRNYQQGLMWTLAYHPRIPKEVRDIVSQWGTTKDEFIENNGWSDQLYIREARRMISDYVLTQKHCESIETAFDAIGLGAYGMDSHPVQRYVDVNGFAQNEGNVEAPVSKPYPISYRSITPKRNECSNLLVPVCVSATHIAFGSIRMEPVFMVLGQSAALAACLAVNKNIAVQDIDYSELKEMLVSKGQIIK